MAKTVCKILGVVFVIVGVAGFAAPTLLGAHLNPAHNLVHIVSGALALYFGFAGSAGAARGVFILFRLVFLLLGGGGWFFGTGPGHMFYFITLLFVGEMMYINPISLGVFFLPCG